MMPELISPPTRLTPGDPVTTARRLRLIRVLFVSDHAAELDQHVRELEHQRFAMSAHVACNAEEFAARLRAHPYDVVVSDATLRDWTGMGALECLRERDPDTPFILVAAPADDDTVADFMLKGASDCVDRSRLHFLPLAVALAVEERAARDERNRVEQKLQRSRAVYNALMENPTYGVCLVDVAGRFVHANEALVAMLGYASHDELLQANLVRDVMLGPGLAAVQEAMGRTDRIDGLHVDWARKDGTLLRIRLSGRQIHDEATDVDPEWELIAEDLTAQRALEEHLRHLATTDPLTGLANYRRLAEALDTEVRRSERTGREFAVLMLDLDGMKQINDQYGHLTGDQALRRVADALLCSCRSTDTVARYAGDEFAVLLPETGPDGATAIERRIRKRLSRPGEQEDGPRLSASVGVAVYPRDGATIEHLLLTADQALYRMKRGHTSTMAPH
jgi:diguanylate cyclase (GGDEF)-like protein/PAS domain S-box-containing protein